MKYKNNIRAPAAGFHRLKTGCSSETIRNAYIVGTACPAAMVKYSENEIKESNYKQKSQYNE